MNIEQVTGRAGYLYLNIPVVPSIRRTRLSTIYPYSPTDDIGAGPGKPIELTEEIAKKIELIVGWFPEAQQHIHGKPLPMKGENQGRNYNAGPDTMDTHITYGGEKESYDGSNHNRYLSGEAGQMPTPKDILKTFRETGVFIERTKPQSLAEFIEKYWQVKQPDGTMQPLKLREIDKAFLEGYEKAVKAGGYLTSVSLYRGPA